MGDRARKLTPVIVLTLVTLALVFPIALGKSLWLRDIVRYTYPLKLYLRERLLDGHLPLWNPRLGLGRPFLGIIQPGVLYPGNLIVLLPAPFGVDLFFSAHVLVAALGMRAWLRRLDVDEVGATFGGASLALSGYVVAMYSGSGFYLVGIAWVPWALAEVVRSAEGPGWPARAAWLAIFLALPILGGDPQATFFAGILGGVQALVAGAGGPAPASPGGGAERSGAPGVKRVGRALAALAVGGLLAGLIAAAQLLPAIEAAGVGRPGGVTLSSASNFALHPGRLIELLWPAAFGEPHSHDWLLHRLYDRGTGQAIEPWASSIYIGLATPFLAAAAVAMRRRVDWVLALVAIVAVLIACGPYLPLWEPFFEHVPGARLFRYSEKYFFLPTICLCALAARGLGPVSRAPRRAAIVGAAILGVLAAGAVLAATHGEAIVATLSGLDVDTSDAAEWMATRARAALLIGGALWLPLVLGATGRLPPRGIAIGLATIAVVDLLVATLPILSWTRAEVYQEPSPVIADMARVGPEKRLYRPLHINLADHEFSPALQRASLLPDSGIEDGIDQLEPYDVFPLPRETLMWRALQKNPVRLLRITATPFALLASIELGEKRPPELSPVAEYRGWDSTLMHVAGVMDRVALVRRVIVARDPLDAATKVSGPDMVPGETTVIEAAEPHTAEGSCTLDDDRTERLGITCHASAPTYVVVADAWFPGWSATVNGLSAPIHPANVAMRAIPIPAGDSIVELTYQPWGWTTGRWLSGLGVLLTIAMIVVKRRRRPTIA